MRRRLLLAGAMAVAFSVTGVAQRPVLRPRLLVTVVVDQMRADYLTAFQRHWHAGFRTLLSDGAVFDRAEYPYLNTVTCAGHATVSTGTFPRTHGMVGNEWWDRGRRTLIDCVLDDSAPHVSYGSPAKSGNSPRLLLTPTLGDTVRDSTPGSRVVSVSLKPDTSITLAGHGGDIAVWADIEAGAFVSSTAFTGSPAPVLTEFFSRDPIEPELRLTWNLSLPPDAYRSADATFGQRPPAGRNGLFPHEISGPKGPNENSFRLWRQSPFSDGYIARMASALVDGLELGRDDNPDVLNIGFSALDVVGHAFGPESREVEDVLVNLDRTLGNVVAMLDQKVGRDRYVLALTADHGVAATPQPGGGGRVIREDVVDRIEDVLIRRWGPGEGGEYVQTVQSAFLYFSPGVFKRLRADRAAWGEVLKQLQAVPGVARAIPVDELSANSSDPIVRAAALSYRADRSGDVALVTAPNWMFSGRVITNATNHGGWQEHDRRVPLILFGGAIRAGHFGQQVTPADIAPTLASLIQVPLPSAEGRVLQEALRSASPLRLSRARR